MFFSKYRNEKILAFSTAAMACVLAQWASSEESYFLQRSPDAFVGKWTGVIKVGREETTVTLRVPKKGTDCMIGFDGPIPYTGAQKRNPTQNIDFQYDNWCQASSYFGRGTILLELRLKNEFMGEALLSCVGGPPEYVRPYSFTMERD